MTATAGGKPEHSTAEAGPERMQGPSTLDGQYGEIGISAVAAALRYAGAHKNPAYAPVAPLDHVAPQDDERFVELAA
jgi:hypothetical protein